MNFEPYQILPAQLGAASNEWPGERRLMLAVLDEAVATIIRRAACVSLAEQREIDAAERWLASDDRESPFSFVNVAEALGLDPAYVRRGIREARDWRREIARWKRERIHTTRIISGPIVAADSAELRREYSRRGLEATAGCPAR